VPATTATVEQSIKQRYSSAANEREATLCCPVDYDALYLEVIPREIIERDYGCGDPSKHLRPGETVLDLGSGGGKICYIASQVVGAEGKVIGVDMNDEMLALANRYRGEVGDRIGYHNVSFLKGKIQDLALDYGNVDAYLAERPILNAENLEAFEAWKENERRSNPMIPTASVDVVVSNCVLNLVRSADKITLFKEMHRVLKKGGRAVISDIVSDEDIPAHLQNDPKLWSGCLSGAFREDLFIEAFEEAGFYGIRILKRDEKPWQTIEGIEFRSVTVEAFKGKEGPCLERYQAVVYKGPWRRVTDDDGHTLHRGERMAVCEKTFRIYMSEPYKQDIEPIEPYEDIPLSEAAAFDCRRDAVRGPRETKGLEYKVTDTTDAPYCGPDGNCC
jgi:ubiquinone/menaquinone biosynthesis C-methylase UbiE